MSYGTKLYSPLSLEVLARRTVITEGLYDPELPNCILAELEKVWLLAGSYRVYQEFRKLERMDKQPITDAQWHLLMDELPCGHSLPCGHCVKSLFGEFITITEQEDFNKWIIKYSNTEVVVEPGYRKVNDHLFFDTFFENGGIKVNKSLRDGKGGVRCECSDEYRLTGEGDLVLVRNFINIEGDVLCTKTFLAKKADF
jgi:hypothetical protein